MKRIYPVLIILIVVVIFALLLNFGSGTTGEKDNFLAALLSYGKYLFNLINKENTIGYFAPSDLVELSWLQAPGEYIRAVALVDLVDMVIAAKKAGAKLKIISAYRGHYQQELLFSRYSASDKNASMFSAKAGHSEHQLGTTIDFGAGNSDIDLTWQFAETRQGRWLVENAWKFGFALSYPKGKEKITGYQYEPWHYRYIGRKAAKDWQDSGLTLHEFLSSKKQHYKEDN